MTKDILAAATGTVNNLMQTIAAFPPEKFNIVPFEGSWTAAQVADHILKSITGITELLYAPTGPTTRQPGEKVDEIRKVFLDFSIKMQSPDFVLPRNEPIDKGEMITAWESANAKLEQSIQTLDLTATCTAFELPGSGKYTRTEWIWFAICHMQRHTHQLKNIYNVLMNKQHLVS